MTPITLKYSLHQPLDALGSQIYFKNVKKGPLPLRLHILPLIVHDLIQIPKQAAKAIQFTSVYVIKIATLNRLRKDAQFSPVLNAAYKTVGYAVLVLLSPIEALGTLVTPRTMIWFHRPVERPACIHEAIQFLSTVEKDWEKIVDEENKIYQHTKEWEEDELETLLKKLILKIEKKQAHYQKNYDHFSISNSSIGETKSASLIIKKMDEKHTALQAAIALEEHLLTINKKMKELETQTPFEDESALREAIEFMDRSSDFIGQNEAQLKKHEHNSAKIKQQLQAMKLRLDYHLKWLKERDEYRTRYQSVYPVKDFDKTPLLNDIVTRLELLKEQKTYFELAISFSKRRPELVKDAEIKQYEVLVKRIDEVYNQPWTGFLKANTEILSKDLSVLTLEELITLKEETEGAIEFINRLKNTYNVDKYNSKLKSRLLEVKDAIEIKEQGGEVPPARKRTGDVGSTQCILF